MTTFKVDPYSPNIGEYVHALKLATFLQEQDMSFKVGTNSPIRRISVYFKVDTFSPYTGE